MRYREALFQENLRRVRATTDPVAQASLPPYRRISSCELRNGTNREWQSHPGSRVLSLSVAQPTGKSAIRQPGKAALRAVRRLLDFSVRFNHSIAVIAEQLAQSRHKEVSAL
jgi:hypothetical protein